MQRFAPVAMGIALLASCKGEGSSGAGSAGSASSAPISPQLESWTVGGISVSTTVLPKQLNLPTIMPVQPGKRVTQMQQADMRIVAPDQLVVDYILGEPPDDDAVIGYRVKIYADPIPDLQKAWGPSKPGPVGGDVKVNECWEDPKMKIRGCASRLGDQKFWRVEIVMTDKSLIEPAPTAKPAPAGTYEDYPVEVGPCEFISIGEASQILGTQMQYLAPAEADINCQLLPAKTKGASRPAGMVSASEASSQVPDLLIGVRKPAGETWEPAIPGLGEKAMYDGDRVQFLMKGAVYRIAIIDPKLSATDIKDRALKIAKKVAARVEASHDAP